MTILYVERPLYQLGAQPVNQDPDLRASWSVLAKMTKFGQKFFGSICRMISDKGIPKEAEKFLKEVNNRMFSVVMTQKIFDGEYADFDAIIWKVFTTEKYTMDDVDKVSDALAFYNYFASKCDPSFQSKVLERVPKNYIPYAQEAFKEIARRNAALSKIFGLLNKNLLVLPIKNGLDKAEKALEVLADPKGHKGEGQESSLSLASSLVGLGLAALSYFPKAPTCFFNSLTAVGAVIGLASLYIKSTLTEFEKYKREAKEVIRVDFANLKKEEHEQNTVNLYYRNPENIQKASKEFEAFHNAKEALLEKIDQVENYQEIVDILNEYLAIRHKLEMPHTVIDSEKAIQSLKQKLEIESIATD